MRFALADVKKRVLRRDGTPFIIPHLLKPKELLSELAALIALYDASVGQPRAFFPEDRPAELIGDYRIARCLTACLSEWYEWCSPAWPGTATAQEAAALIAAAIASPSHLRLALYDEVNSTAGGYLATAEREQHLDAFAAGMGLARATLDILLRLDEEPQAILMRMAQASPTAHELALRYNQRVVEALLFNASQVEWLLPATMTDGAGGGLGTVLKRICFLARQMGVRYDVAFAGEGHVALPESDERPALRVAEQRQEYIAGPLSQPSPPPDGEREAARRGPLPMESNSSPPSTKSSPASVVEPAPHGPFPAREGGWGLGQEALPTLDGYGQPLQVTLYGPQEVMGAPNQYGERLTLLCRALLGYRRAVGTGTAALAGAGLLGTAQVYLYGRPTAFTLDDRLLRLLGTTKQDHDITINDSIDRLFDSSLERQLAADFAALEQAGEARGWRLDREPEPVLADDTILVPDFALTRGNRRVYLEVAGYWRPGYRERKARKLTALRRRVSMIVAAPESARSEFAALQDDFPFLWYTNRLSVQALLDLLERDFNDFSARRAQLDLPRIRQEVQRRGHIPQRESMALLHVYTRNELAAVLAQIEQPYDEDVPDSVQPKTIVWLEGIGLCSDHWRETLLAQVRALVTQAPEQKVLLATLHAHLVSAAPELQALTESTVESLAQLAGCTIVRSSIFEADVLAPGISASPVPEKPVQKPARMPRTQPHTAQRRKHSRTPYETQTIFPLEPAEEDE